MHRYERNAVLSVKSRSASKPTRRPAGYDADELLTRSYAETITRVNGLREDVAGMRCVASRLVDEMAELDRRVDSIRPDVDQHCDDVVSHGHELEVDRYLADMIERLIEFGSRTRYVPYYMDVGGGRQTKACRRAKRAVASTKSSLNCADVVHCGPPTGSTGGHPLRATQSDTATLTATFV